jgi:hypothetical protein
MPMTYRAALFLLIAIFLPATDARGQHRSFTNVLKIYVANGMVNYSGLCQDADFAKYLESLSKTDPQNLSDNARIAFWINAYNAYTLNMVCDNYPIKSVNDLHVGGKIFGPLLGTTIWRKKNAMINGEALSLYDIEHKIIFKDFSDPRIHFALANATKGSPPLRPEAYEGRNLNAQLDSQAALFLGQATKNWFQREKKEAHLSPIFRSERNDFGANQEKLLLFISRFLPEDTAAVIKANPRAWRIHYTDYDWDLNER